MHSAVPHSQGESLYALNFRSLAGPSLRNPQQIADIVCRMRPMNQGRGVTGAIQCNQGQIEQWIEGPEAAVSDLWDRIRLDPRHRVEWASQPAVVTVRHFPGSPMKLAMTTADLARLDAWPMDDLLTLPDGQTPDGIELWDAKPYPFEHHARAGYLVQTHAAALADLLNGPNPQAARVQIATTLRDAGMAECSAVVQAVLRQVHAAWSSGLTSSLQRQLALTVLQSALRLWLCVEEQRQTIGCALVSALPGTPDLCGVMLKVALLRRAGWSVRLLLPTAADRIAATAQDLQPDLIVLAGSRLSVGPNDLATVTSILRALAACGRAPVIVGGMLAETHPQAVLRQGGSAVCGALGWISTIAETLAPAPLAAQPRPSAPHCRMATRRD